MGPVIKGLMAGLAMLTVLALPVGGAPGAALTVALGSGFDAPPNAGAAPMISRVTLDLDHLGPFTLSLSYRKALGSSFLWGATTEKFTAGAALPLNHTTALFADWERNPTTGRAWGWVGVRRKIVLLRGR